MRNQNVRQLNDGNRMPWLGPGVFKINDPQELDDTVEAAWDCGYRSIGVSNFLIHDLELILREGNIVPALNQVEYHPFLNAGY